MPRLGSHWRISTSWKPGLEGSKRDQTASARPNVASEVSSPTQRCSALASRGASSSRSRPTTPGVSTSAERSEPDCVILVTP